MPTCTDQPASLTIEGYLDACLFLLVATGFITLAGTGKLDLPSMIGVTAALLARGYLLARGRVASLSEGVISGLTLAYVLFYVADFFLISRMFVTATLHLVLFSIVVKIFSVRRDRDRLYLGILGFMAVLGAAVLTVDSIFLAGFCVFLLVSVAAFVAFEMKRSAAKAQIARPLHRPGRSLPVSLSATATVLMLGIALGSSVIFFVLPRFSLGYLSAYAPHNQLISGFSDSIRLGQIGEIKQSDAVVMHIQIEGDRRGGEDLKWRGVALGIFNQNRWSNPSQPIPVPATPSGFDLQRAAGGLGPRSGSRILRYRVLMEPIGSNVFFLAPGVKLLFGNYAGVAMDEGGTVFNLDRDRVITTYRAVSDVAEPEPSELRRSSREIPPEIALRYLQTPALDRRIPQLAHQITAEAATAYDKAVALQRYLRTNYGYTLQLSGTAVRDPLADFLFERKQGHCEYFASAMAIMLRTIGIPSRVVNGFRTGEFNPLTGSYIIRARDAHSWVEAYFPREGWTSFDPTPPDPRPAISAWTRGMLYLDALREFWREWVINYDLGHQATLAVGALQQSRRALQSSRQWWHSTYDAMLVTARRTRAGLVRKPRRTGGITLGVIVGILLALNLGRIRRFWRHRTLAGSPQSAPQAAATIWYGRMTRALASRGYRKSSTQTPAEFASTIEEESLRRSVAAFTECYHRARFGNSPEDASALAELFAHIRKP